MVETAVTLTSGLGSARSFLRTASASSPTSGSDRSHPGLPLRPGSPAARTTNSQAARLTSALCDASRRTMGGVSSWAVAARESRSAGTWRSAARSAGARSGVAGSGEHRTAMGSAEGKGSAEEEEEVGEEGEDNVLEREEREESREEDMAKEKKGKSEEGSREDRFYSIKDGTPLFPLLRNISLPEVRTQYSTVETGQWKLDSGNWRLDSESEV